MVRALFVLYFAFASALLLAAPLELKSGQSYKVHQQAEFLFASTSDQSLSSTLASDQWQAIQKNRINFGFITSPVWVRFSLKSTLDEDWVVRISYPLIDYLDFYLLNNGQVIDQSQTGDLRPFHQRKIDHNHFVQPITMKTGSEYQVVIRVDTQGAAELPIIIEEKAVFESENRLRDFARGFVNGIFIIMLLYNLIIYFFIREPSYAFYVINASVYLVQLSIFDGSGFQYFWPDNPDYNRYAFPFFNGLMQLTQFLFLVVFLEILKRKSWYVTPVKCVMAAMVPLPILGITMDYHTIIPIQVLFAIFVNLSGIVFGVYYSIKGETSARYFTLAWFLFLLGLLIVNLKSFGLVPNNLFTEYSYQIGAFVEMTLLSLALAQRIQSSQQKVISLQNANIEALEKYQNLYENSLSGQFQIDEKGNIYSMNPAFIRMFHLNEKPIESHEDNEANVHVNDLIVDQKPIEPLRALLKQHQPIVDEEVQLKTQNGDIRWFSLSVRPAHNRTEKKSHFEASVLDIHERKINDEIKEQSLIDRMSSLEQLAVGICHEINTPLGVSVTASSHLQKLIDDLKLSFDRGDLTKKGMASYISDERNSIDIIEEELNKISRLITQFKQVSVKQLAIRTEQRPLHQIILSACDEMAAEIQKKNVHINVDCPDSVAYFGHCDAIKMVLLELIENSIVHGFQAQQGGEISIVAKLHQDQLEILYMDSGSGVDAENSDTLFNAFYTTKRGIEGRVGLGLYKVYNLVTQLLKGNIEYAREDRSCFRIVFPIQTLAADADL